MVAEGGEVCEADWEKLCRVVGGPGGWDDDARTQATACSTAS